MSNWVPVVLFALALAVLAVGFRFPRRFRHPGVYITGLILTALGFASFWPLHVMLSAWVSPSLDPLLRFGAVAFLPFFVSVSLFGGGLDLIINKANSTPHRYDLYDDLLERIIRTPQSD